MYLNTAQLWLFYTSCKMNCKWYSIGNIHPSQAMLFTNHEEMETLCRCPGLWLKQCALPFADTCKENFPTAHKIIIIIIIALHTQIINSPTYI